jgi:hypothetical protein
VRIYVESNFVLEIASQQEEAEAAEQILGLAEARRIALVVPALSLFEPFTTITRRTNERLTLVKDLANHIRQVGRSRDATELNQHLEQVASSFDAFGEAHVQRFRDTVGRIVNCAHVVPADKQTIREALEAGPRMHLSLPDSIVYASVIADLRATDEGPRRFLNKNSKDFDNPDVSAELEQMNCPLIRRFDQALGFIRQQLGAG